MNNIENRTEVIRSAFTLARSLKRRPQRDEHRFSPATERSLLVIGDNEGLSSADLGEALDIRPSSVSELVGKLTDAGLVTRQEDGQDKRLSRIYLTEKGKAEVELIRSTRKQVVEEFSACFTDEEAAQFCALADKLSAHLNEKAQAEGCENGRPCGRRPHRGPGHPGMHRGPKHGPAGFRAFRRMR